jgi:DeoR/GlpR family transcriptional regulator of sugar metabolism
MGTFARALRLCEMMEILQNRWYAVAELVERYRVTRRTIYRDLLALEGDPFYCPLVRNGGMVRLIPPGK